MYSLRCNSWQPHSEINKHVLNEEWMKSWRRGTVYNWFLHGLSKTPLKSSLKTKGKVKVKLRKQSQKKIGLKTEQQSKTSQDNNLPAGASLGSSYLPWELKVSSIQDTARTKLIFIELNNLLQWLVYDYYHFHIYTCLLLTIIQLSELFQLF